MPPLSSYLIMSHGETCSEVCATKKEQRTTTFNLPSNILVVANCYNSEITSDAQSRAKLWEFATNTGLHDRLASPTDDVFALQHAFLEYARTIHNFNTMNQHVIQKSQSNNDEYDLGFYTNEFCVYTGRCPEILVRKESKTFTSVVAKMPVQVDGISNDMIKSYIEKYPIPPRCSLKSMSNYCKVDAFVNHGQGEHSIAVMSSYLKNLPMDGCVPLSLLIKDIAKREKEALVVVFVFACTKGSKALRKRGKPGGLTLYQGFKRFMENNTL
jgi:hypothetical protein